MWKGHHRSLETTSSGRQQLTKVKVDRYLSLEFCPQKITCKETKLTF